MVGDCMEWGRVQDEIESIKPQQKRRRKRND